MFYYYFKFNYLSCHKYLKQAKNLINYKKNKLLSSSILQ